jgi:protein-S-isoprenylcysteine O-methyltransferase Ste14
MRQWRFWILSCIWGPLLIAQFVLVFVFRLFNEAGLDVVMYAGYAIWVISAILGWLPILVLKRVGGVAKGKSYVHTTKLVKTGIYSIIRHPQYTAGLLLTLALMLVSQSYPIIAMGVVVMVLLYIDIMVTDRGEIEKFGDEYRQYMKEVPRANFLLGILRLLKRRFTSGTK